MMRVVKSTKMWASRGDHIAIFNIALVSVEPDRVGGPLEVQIQYGRQGSPLHVQYWQQGSPLHSEQKTLEDQPVKLATATEIFDQLCAEKIALGFRLTGGLKEVVQHPAGPPALSPVLPQMPNPVKDDEQLENLIQDPNWVMQEKVDGERRMILVKQGAVFSCNESGVDVVLPAKTLAALAQMPVGLFLDGELVGHHYYVFDVVSDANGETIDRTFVDRLKFIGDLGYGRERLSTESPVNYVMRVVTAHSTQEKRQLLADVKKAGGEGVVFKRRNAPYVPGRPNSAGDQLAYTLYETAVVVVFGAMTSDRSVRIAVWKDSSGMELEYVGRVTIPPNVILLESGDHIEVRYPYADPSGLWQPTFLRVRRDVKAADTWDSLKFKTVQNAFLAW